VAVYVARSSEPLCLRGIVSPCNSVISRGAGRATGPARERPTRAALYVGSRNAPKPLEVSRSW